MIMQKPTTINVIVWWVITIVLTIVLLFFVLDGYDFEDLIAGLIYLTLFKIISIVKTIRYFKRKMLLRAAERGDATAQARLDRLKYIEKEKEAERKAAEARRAEEEAARKKVCDLCGRAYTINKWSFEVNDKNYCSFNCARAAGQV
jgi:hypothetical protein